MEVGDSQISDYLYEVVAKALQTTPEKLRADFANKQRQRRERVARSNAAYYDAMESVTVMQETVIGSLEAQGAKRQKQIWQNRASGNIAVMMVKEAWDGQKMKMGRKLIMVYPDGTMSQTFEKSISIKKEF